MQLLVTVNITDSGLDLYIVRNVESCVCVCVSQCNCVNVSVVVGVDAAINESSVEDVIRREERIVSQWREVSTDEKSQLRDKVDEIVRPLGLQTRLIVLERANSVALYFICMTLLAVMSLRDQWRSGQLRDIVESLFTFLSGTTARVIIKRLTWPLTEYERCLEFFDSLQGKPTI